MGKHEKIMDKILRGTSDANILFDDLEACCSISASGNESGEVIISIERKVSEKSDV